MVPAILLDPAAFALVPKVKFCFLGETVPAINFAVKDFIVPAGDLGPAVKVDPTDNFSLLNNSGPTIHPFLAVRFCLAAMVVPHIVWSHGQYLSCEQILVPRFFLFCGSFLSHSYGSPDDPF